MTNNDPCDERWKAVALVYRQAAWVSARVRPRNVAKNRPTTTRYYDRVIDMIFFQIVLRLSTHMCKFIWPSSRENETILTILCKGQHLWRSGHYWYISQRLLCARTVHPSTHSDISSLTVFDGRPFVVCLIYIYIRLCLNRPVRFFFFYFSLPGNHGRVASSSPSAPNGAIYPAIGVRCCLVCFSTPTFPLLYNFFLAGWYACRLVVYPHQTTRWTFVSVRVFW